MLLQFSQTGVVGPLVAGRAVIAPTFSGATYQWLSGGMALVGETGASHTIGSSEVTKPLVCQILTAGVVVPST